MVCSAIFEKEGDIEWGIFSIFIIVQISKTEGCNNRIDENRETTAENGGARIRVHRMKLIQVK